MKKIGQCLVAACVASVGLFATPALARDIKVGVVAGFSGPFAGFGTQFRQGIELYQEEHGVEVGDHTVSIIYRDSATKPDVAKRLAEELIIQDRVDVIGGIGFTPEAVAIAPVLTEAEIPGVTFNAGTHFVTRESPMLVRTSFTLDQSMVPMVEWASKEAGVKRAIIAATDYAPGQAAAKTYQEEFQRHGIELVDTILMPYDTKDFSVFVQRIKDAKPDGVFLFIPTGTPSIAFIKTAGERGLKDDGIKIFGLAEFTDHDLPQFDDSIIGAYSAWPYSNSHDSDKNRAFLAAYAKKFPNSTADYSAVMAYDGMHAIYEMIRATDGKMGPAAVEAIKGFSWESPRGPISIDPAERDIVQNIYIREVVKDGDHKANREIVTFENVKDPWKERNPAKE